MAVLMYTFGVFVQCEELRINVRMPFACAVTDAISLLCMGEKKGLFDNFCNAFVAFFSCFTPALQCHSQNSLLKCLNSFIK